MNEIVVADPRAGEQPVALARLSALRAIKLADVVAALGERMALSRTLAEAAQTFATAIYDVAPAELALVRTYALVPAAALTAAHRGFLSSRAAPTPLSPETPVLTLIGTRGAQREWNDPRGSRDHLCIPLISPEAVMAVPMIAALLTQLGLDLSWLMSKREVFARKLVGGFNGLFYVPDAARAADKLGRLIIPAQDFVAGNRIVTVFGNGGAYVDGTIVASIFFTRELLSYTDAERFAPLASTFKTRTSHLVAAARLFPE